MLDRLDGLPDGSGRWKLVQPEDSLTADAWCKRSEWGAASLPGIRQETC